jgi:hypothetical protein
MEMTKVLLNWIAAVSWPLIALTVLVVFRNQLGSLLSNVSGIAERIHKQPVEIALGEQFKLIFRESLMNVEQQAKELIPKGTPGVDLPPDGGAKVHTPETRGSSMDAPLPSNYQVNLDRLAEILPRAAIIEAWREVELAIEHAAISEGLTTPRSLAGTTHSEYPGVQASPAVLARLLFEKHVIDEATLSVLEQLRQLRNQASHLPNFQPSVDDAKEYVRLALALAFRIHSHYVR